ncbi:MAG: GNAT family N-acetyltransferase [Acidobacteriota bacterium]
MSENSKVEVCIRQASTKDIRALTSLANQLGYDVSFEEIEQRFNEITKLTNHIIYVAEIMDENVVGWIHISIRNSLTTALQAEIGGFIVDERHRKSGIGKLLVQQAEQWAQDNGCKSVYLRSNIIRKDAHIFYQKAGYKNIKTQFAFRKMLPSHLPTVM